MALTYCQTISETEWGNFCFHGWQPILCGIMSHQFQVAIDDELFLTEFLDSDEARIVELLNDPAIYATTLRIPHPYHAKDARFWIEYATKIHSELNSITNWAIRSKTQGLLGGIGLIFAEGIMHRVEIGYWIGKPFWGRGIASRAVGRVERLCFEQFDFQKLTALVFSGNQASARVLEKNCFQQEGVLRNHFLKNGSFIDAICFGKVAAKS